jgi:WD40 repeat protein
MDKVPFKFLDAYTKEDKDIFFGRETEIEELYQKVFESKLLLVCGVSGTGKTSLIKCGLANKFEDSDWLPVYIRRGNEFTESLWNELEKVAITPLRAFPLKREGKISKQLITSALQSIYLDHFKPIYLIFDQFEEIFIFGSREERKAFIDEIKQIIDSDIQCRLLFIIREEYLAGTIEFEKEIPTFLTNRLRIEKMTWQNARKVIEGPCLACNIDLEEGLTDRILETLSPESTEVELTYLQVLMDKLVKLAEKVQIRDDPASVKNEEFGITHHLLDQAGNVKDLLGSFLEEQIDHLDDPETGLIILKSFVSVKGTKRQVNTEEISDFVQTMGGKIPEEKLINLIQKFIHLRILRDKDENDRYELRHDSLATKIYEKITLYERELLEVRHFIENAYTNYEKRGIFLNHDDLGYLAIYEDRLFLNRELNNFLEQSKKILTARKRSFNRILAWSAVGFLLIIIAIGIYYFRFTKSVKTEDLAVTALLQQDLTPELSYENAKTTYLNDTNSVLAVKALFNAFYILWDKGPYYDSGGVMLPLPQQTFFNFTPCSSEIRFARFSEDGQYIYGYLADNTVKVWNTEGEEIFSEKENRAPVMAVYLAPDNKHIAALDYDSIAIFWNLEGHMIFSTKVPYWFPNPFNVIGFSPDKPIIACLGADNSVDIYNTGGNFLYKLTGHKATVNCLDFSPDGNFLASGSNDSTILIYKYNNPTGIFEKYCQLTEFYYRGMIRSVDFAKNSKYILSNICDSNTIVYISNLINLLTYPLRLLSPSLDTAYLNHSPWYLRWPYHSARFTRDNAAVIISRLSGADTIHEKNFTLNSDSIFYEYRIIFSDESDWKLLPPSKYAAECKTCPYDEYYTYSGIDLSGKGYIASTLTGTEYTLLTHWNGLTLSKLPGIHPDFSPDGHYLLLTDHNQLRLYPAFEKEIIRLIDEKEIFGKLKKKESDWRHIYFDW